MGLSRGLTELLIREAARKPFSGSIATLGRQTITATRDQIEAQFAKNGLAPKTQIDPMDDRTLFAAFGFDVVHSLDCSDYEGATHIFDLNQPTLPKELGTQYDVVLDSGTLEHIFHVPNALKNIVGLMKIGGRVVFQSPSSNHIDHGFYMFSPTFFIDYLLANKFEIETLYVLRYSFDLTKPWDVYEYRPGPWSDFQALGLLDASPYLIYVIATKTAESSSDAIPQQGFYSASYYEAKSNVQFSRNEEPPIERLSFTRRSRRLIKRILNVFPGAAPFIQYQIWRARERSRLAKRLVGRF
jgi:SAM-dependent methyltransferase